MRRGPKGTREGREVALRRYLADLGESALGDLILEGCQAVPEFAGWLEERRVLAGGEVDTLAERVADLIAAMPAEPDWNDGWGRRAYAEPTDYDALRRSLEALLDAGGADPILELMPELVRKGRQEVDLFHHDDGLGDEIGRCLEVAWRALRKSRLSPSEQILYALDLSLADDYGLVPDLDPVRRRHRKKATWSAVADELRSRLEDLPVVRKGDRSGDGYRRRQLVDAAVDALDRAGRGDEAEAVCAREARSAGAYGNWVRRLLAEGRAEEAERRALEGLGQAEEREFDLRALLREAVEAQRAWARLAALRAEDFRHRPSFASYEKLLQAAGKARRKRTVRAKALAFLEAAERGEAMRKAGLRPLRKTPPPAKAGQDGSRWDLPAVPEAARLPDAEHQGRAIVRLEVALAEGRPAEVLACYDRVLERRQGGAWLGTRRSHDLPVAEAVKASHPDRALAIYTDAVEALVARTKPDLYPEAGRLLKAMRPVFRRAGKPEAWTAYVAELREKHRRKRRFLEVLDGLGA